MTNTLVKILMVLITWTLFGELAEAQSRDGANNGGGRTSSSYAGKKRTRAYLPQDVEDEVERTQRRPAADDRDDDEEDAPAPPPRRRPRPQAEPVPDRIPYPGSQPQMQPARACYTRWGACPMGIAIPQGSYCTCTNYYGVFPGVAK